jgi:predicted AlkP superfamily pyrophosphatase or phosphodiesterase
MASVPYARMLALEGVIAPSQAVAVHWGEVLGFTPRPGHERTARARLLGRHTGYECWDKAQMPARWHYGTHPRIPPIVCQMDVGWMAVPRARLAGYAPGATRGAHGFDPAAVEMRALFIADGPAFGDGVELPPFDNVDVYPLLTRLLGITAQPNDGNPATLDAALAR